MTRRDIIAGSLALPALAANNKSPNDKLRVAVIGLRGRGKSLIQCFGQMQAENVELVTFCDVDQAVLDQSAAEYEKKSGKTLTRVNDMRRVFDDKSIDVVGIATPNHWHSLAAIWALQAGKDVYVEKPGSHTIYEGRKVMEAAAKYQRILQHGTQNRSSPNIVEGMRQLHAGVIGKVYMARGVAYKGPKVDVGPMTDDPVPAGLNWDAWLGPAPKVGYSKIRHQRPAGISWHMMFDYGNGDIGNQGVHELDMIRWGLGLDTHPNRVSSVGTFVTKNAMQYPHVQSAQYEWDGRDVMVTFETRSGLFNSEAGMGEAYPFLDHSSTVGVIFTGTEGYMIFPDYTSYRTFLGKKRTPGPAAIGAGTDESLPHFQNFIQAVRSRKSEHLHAGPKELHLSSALPHLANIAWRTKRMVQFDPKMERCTDAEANQLLTRKYRAPYIVPEKV